MKNSSNTTIQPEPGDTTPAPPTDSVIDYDSMTPQEIIALVCDEPAPF